MTEFNAMNTAELESFKDRLVRLRQSLLENMDSLTESGKTVELDQTRVGRLSRMDAMQGQQMALASKRRQEGKLLAIGAALRRIEEGDYGLCLDCDQPINPRRLEADPTHARCINCAD